jgi:hypothetical protein
MADPGEVEPLVEAGFSLYAPGHNASLPELAAPIDTTVAVSSPGAIGLPCVSTPRKPNPSATSSMLTLRNRKARRTAGDQGAVG